MEATRCVASRCVSSPGARGCAARLPLGGAAGQGEPSHPCRVRGSTWRRVVTVAAQGVGPGGGVRGTFRRSPGEGKGGAVRIGESVHRAMAGRPTPAERAKACHRALCAPRRSPAPGSPSVPPGRCLPPPRPAQGPAQPASATLSGVTWPSRPVAVPTGPFLSPRLPLRRLPGRRPPPPSLSLRRACCCHPPPPLAVAGKPAAAACILFDSPHVLPSSPFQPWLPWLPWARPAAWRSLLPARPGSFVRAARRRWRRVAGDGGGGGHRRGAGGCSGTRSAPAALSPGQRGGGAGRAAPAAPASPRCRRNWSRPRPSGQPIGEAANSATRCAMTE